jgi:hypothetical protein
MSRQIASLIRHPGTTQVNIAELRKIAWNFDEMAHFVANGAI